MRALEEARAAVALAEPTEMFLFGADAWRDLAEVADRVGGPQDASAARATALSLYRAKGNVAPANQLSAPDDGLRVISWNSEATMTS